MLVQHLCNDLHHRIPVRYDSCAPGGFQCSNKCSWPSSSSCRSSTISCKATRAVWALQPRIWNKMVPILCVERRALRVKSLALSFRAACCFSVRFWPHCCFLYHPKEPKDLSAAPPADCERRRSALNERSSNSSTELQSECARTCTACKHMPLRKLKHLQMHILHHQRCCQRLLYLQRGM